MVMRLNQALIALGLLSMVFLDTAHARAFRCTDADGKVSYSQSPCPAMQQSEQMRGMAAGKQQDRDLCGDARDLAAQAFDDMGNGTEPSEVIDQHGGINSINAATLGVINFAASLRYNTDITPQRAGALAFSRCLGGGFGELHPGDLPKLEEEASDPGELPKLEEGNTVQSGVSAMTSEPAAPVLAPTGNASSPCAMYQQQLDDANKRLRQGYGGNESKALRDEREHYEAQWNAECAD